MKINKYLYDNNIINLIIVGPYAQKFFFNSIIYFLQGKYYCLNLKYRYLVYYVQLIFFIIFILIFIF